jgi:CRP-like cAMP-binding protein
MDHSLCTLMPSQVAFVSHRSIDELIERAPKLAAVLWRSSLADASILRQWMANNGRRTARQRIAHLLCELLVRYRSIGLAQDRRYQFPVTQIELGDAVGVSVVHVNRVLKDLRGEGLVAIAGGYVSVLDWSALKETAGFDASYLHLLKADTWVS